MINYETDEETMRLVRDLWETYDNLNWGIKSRLQGIYTIYRCARTIREMLMPYTTLLEGRVISPACSGEVRDNRAKPGESGRDLRYYERILNKRSKMGQGGV